MGTTGDDEQMLEPGQDQSQTKPFLTPGRAFLFSSIPLTLGTYLGYRRALHESSLSMQSAAGEAVATSLNHSASTNSKALPVLPRPNNALVGTIPAPVIAARALLLGTLVSLSSTSILVAGIFYASGCHSLEELMITWKRWAPRKLREVEGVLGLGNKGDIRRKAVAEYERETAGMTEEEEIIYVGSNVDWDEKLEDKKSK